MEVSAASLAIHLPNGATTSYSYSDAPGALIAALSDVFGAAPEASEHESAGDCDPAYQSRDWRGFALHIGYSFLPDGARFEAQASAAQVNGVHIAGSGGQRVGDDVANEIRTTPDERREQFTSDDGINIATIAIFPPSVHGRNAAEADWAEQLYAENDRLTLVTAPVIPGAAGGC